MKNNLSTDPSPYLQQHKANPVNWQIWNSEVLELAKKEKKPILLSIGYASCHWCHVMAHESFEDNDTAKIMNDNFINIKVDREERPDIDYVFQSSFQIFNRTNGGWPLTMFLDENAVPFTGGTYFPKNEKHGLPSFKSVLLSVIEAYKNQREKIINQANIIKQSLYLKKNPVLNQDLEPFVSSIMNYLDEKKGGFKGAPKFPNFITFDTLIYFYNKTKNKNYLNSTKKLLQSLCSEGIYDHVEGGISRYTVDENWLIPHFEKMLYDNAQFISLLSNYCLIEKNDYFLKKIEQTISFINSNFVNNDNKLLGSAMDADSEGEEGKYYVFSYDEIKNIKNISQYFDVQPGGNWEGKIILRELSSPTQEIINELKKIRTKREKPFFDKKTQVDLNSLWVKALIDANKVLPNNDYLKKAENFYKMIIQKIGDNDIYHSYSTNISFIEDYAFLINSLIGLYENTYNIEYKNKAINLCEQSLNKFYLKDQNIFQKNLINNDDLFYNPVDISDTTISNGNSIMLINLIKLGFKKEADDLARSLHGYLNSYSSMMASSLKSLDIFNSFKDNKICTDKGC